MTGTSSTTTWVALLRGVNVGGNRKVPMARLRELCAAAGFEDVRTYIASGNVVLRSQQGDPAAVRAELEALLRAGFGFPVDVVVRSGRQLRSVVAALPFADDATVSVSFLPAALAAGDVALLRSALLNDADVVVDGGHVYLCTPRGLGQPFLTGAGSRVLGESTNRNWRTVLRLAAMTDEVEAADDGGAH